ncbi:MAG TPA: glucoamylase family protein [Thermoanaerobaculia bacterium]|nr:glucoamylase family protein [Thermoanaerobaculia bacterium]
MRRALAAVLLLAVGCATTNVGRPSGRPQPVTSDTFVDDVQHRTFLWFWETANAQNGLVPDRWPAESFSSIAAVGFGLTAYGIGAERGWVTREAAAQRVLTTLRFFEHGVDGHKGFFYHFVDMKTGKRFKEVELSTIDTTLFLAGALFCQSYFDRDNAVEREIRETAERLYAGAEWTFFLARPPLVAMGWTPEHGLHDYDYTGYNEAMILYLLALGSPTHPISPRAWNAYTQTYKWENEHLAFAPLFGHQYSHVWIDFRGIRDHYMRAKGIDYFENSRRATYAQRAYAIANPMGWRGYGENVWGLTACDGPFDGTWNGKQFWTYSARGTSPHDTRDDGTIAPTAAASSIAFAPEIAIPAMTTIATTYPQVFQKYGFLDSFNATLNFEHPVQMGHIVAGAGWFDNDYLGIDQGPIVAMIENHRSELVWKVMRRNAHVQRGLKRAGFTGGWLGDR